MPGGCTGGGIAQPGCVFTGCGVGRAEDVCTIGCLKVGSIWGGPGVYAGGEVPRPGMLFQYFQRKNEPAPIRPTINGTEIPMPAFAPAVSPLLEPA